MSIETDMQVVVHSIDFQVSTSRIPEQDMQLWVKNKDIRVNVPSQIMVAGNKGDKGDIGPPGDGIQSDPGDFTLIFDNQLI